MKIITVYPDSLGQKIGVKPGDRLLKINGKRVQDNIDYKFRITDEKVLLDLELNGELVQIDVEKEYDDDLGVEFEEMKIRKCANDCVFCFVDQNPPNMRDGMYFRDGDFRMSYLYGHYITMTNMGKNELDRIIEQRLSPLYVSIHVTDKELRKKLFLYKKDDDILNKIKYLTSNNIELHTQIVLMPEINDGDYLSKTLEDLYSFYPILKTCTIVPVGLTEHRKGLMDLKNVDELYSTKLLASFDNIREKYSGNLSPFVLLSDEWYILAKKDFPLLKEYGDADLIENGVGQVRSFLEQFYNEQQYFPLGLEYKKNIAVVTGTLIETIFRDEVLPVLNKIKNLNIIYVPIDNNFFGTSVTVSGLLTGKDIIKALKGNKNYDYVWMSHRVLNDEGEITLDDMTLDDISNELECPVMVSNDSFLELINKIKNV